MGRTKGAANWPWPDMVARLRKYPDRWMMLPQMRDVDLRMVDIIRSRRRHALRMDDGVIRCRVKARYLADNGRVRCALLLKFETHPPREGDADGAIH